MKGAKSKADSSRRADNKLSVKKRKAGDGGSMKAAKKGKAEKDPNKPKRPPSAFFIFMEEFRQQFKEKNPNNKSVAAVGKAAGEKWKSMSKAEKAPYISKQEKRKAEHQKNMAAYEKKKTEKKSEPEEEEEEEEEEGEESDKSKSEVNDDDEEDEEEGSGEEDEDD